MGVDRKRVAPLAAGAWIGCCLAAPAAQQPRPWTRADSLMVAAAAEAAAPPSDMPSARASALVMVGEALASAGEDMAAKGRYLAAMALLKGTDPTTATLVRLARDLADLDDASDALLVDDISHDPAARVAVLTEAATSAIRRGDMALARVAVAEAKALRPAPPDAALEAGMRAVAASFASRGRYADALSALPVRTTGPLTLRVVASAAVRACRDGRDKAVAKAFVGFAERYVRDAAARGTDRERASAYGEALATAAACGGSPDLASSLPTDVRPAAEAFAVTEGKALRDERAAEDARRRAVDAMTDPEETAKRAWSAANAGDEDVADEAAARTLSLLADARPGPGWTRGMRAALDASRAACSRSLARAGRYGAATKAAEGLTGRARLTVAAALVEETVARGTREDATRAAEDARRAAAGVTAKEATTALAPAIRRLDARGFAPVARSLAAAAGASWSGYAAGDPSPTDDGPRPTPEAATAEAPVDPGARVAESVAKDDLVGASRQAEAMPEGDARDAALAAVARAQASGRLAHAAFGTAMRISGREARFRALMAVASLPPS